VVKKGRWFCCSGFDAYSIVLFPRDASVVASAEQSSKHRGKPMSGAEQFYPELFSVPSGAPSAATSSNSKNMSGAATAPSAVICRLSEVSSADIARIELESNRPPWSERLFLNEFSNQCSLTFGARTDGELAGFVVVHAVIDEAHIVNFAVASRFRRRGVGRELLSYLLQDLFIRGVRWVTLEVRRSNEAARGLYENLGFQEVGVRQGYYPDNQEDALVMSLNLVHFISRK
jgi:ribosomal-protein-alanine N-acetyltransferase